MTYKNHHATNALSEVISTRNLDLAYRAVCNARKEKGPHDDIWDLRFHWEKERAQFQASLLSGDYGLSPIAVFKTENGTFTRWSARDAVVLKALAQYLTPLIQKIVGAKCYHLKDHGGIRVGVQALVQRISAYRHAVQSDVADFYHSMNHAIVLEQCKKIIKDRRILSLIQQYLNRCEVRDGNHTLVEQGIPKGCPLSPLMGALMLKSLDDCIPEGALYVRYMDDWVIAVKTKTQLRRMVKKMHQVMHRLKFKLAADKTFIGKISRGFDFLGYRIGAQGIIGIAKRSIQKHNERKAKLYEQGASDQRIQAYVRRWKGSFLLTL
jgi:RNA-directed DNA polymerase